MKSGVVIKGQFPRHNRIAWTRSFPEGSVRGRRWMLEVLEDLRDYAACHNLGEAEALLGETRGRMEEILQRK